jgi:hypothetical protein
MQENRQLNWRWDGQVWVMATSKQLSGSISAQTFCISPRLDVPIPSRFSLKWCSYLSYVERGEKGVIHISLASSQKAFYQ